MSAAAMDAARAAARAEARRCELDAAPLWRQRLLEKDFFQYTNLVLAFSYAGPPGRPADHLFKCRIGKFHAPFLTFPRGTVSQGFLPFGASSNRYHHCCHPRCSDECKRIVMEEDAAIAATLDLEEDAAIIAAIEVQDLAEVPPLFPLPKRSLLSLESSSDQSQIRVSS